MVILKVKGLEKGKDHQTLLVKVQILKSNLFYLCSSVDSSERQHFYDVLEQLLEGLEPSVNAEESFIGGFFHVEVNTALSPGSGIISPSKNSGSLEIRRLMTILFGCIESELNLFLTHYEKLEAR